MRRFYSIEYRDLDGDPNVKHAFMNEAELREFVAILRESGVEGMKIHDLIPSSVDTAVAVLSSHGEEPLLGTGT